MDALRGKLIALEGIDGIGKSTATRALAGALADAGLRATVYDFPVYTDPWFGPLVSAFLHGELTISGDAAPRAIATLFAGNRAATMSALRSRRDAGDTLLCDRYCLSNAAYQGAKVPPEDLDAFLDWILEIEVGVFGALRPDVSLWLDVPPELKPDTQADDVHEADEDLQRRVRGVYARLCERGEVVRVDGTEDGTLLAPGEVAARLLSVLQG